MATLSVPPSEPREQTALRSTAFSGVFFWGAVGLLLMGLLTYVFIVWGGMDHFTDADAARVLERQKILQDITDSDHKLLHDAPSYFKKEAGLVRVPIDRAMAMTVEELKRVKPHPAYPIAQSPPQSSAAPTSPDKGPSPGAPVPGKTNDVNAPASNPTVGPGVPAPAPAAAPGNPPVPGAQAQPPAPPVQTNTSGAVPSATPDAAATASPKPSEPAASPAGTP